jgi:predicted nucleic acid-binding protein
MIVVDSSVWIELLRGNRTPEVEKLLSRGHAEIVVGDMILLELLQGARGEAHANWIERRLRHFTILPMLGERLAVQAARNYRHLRQRGITLRKTMDLIIGTYCIEDRHVLLHNDRDFAPMAEHLGLQVL